MHLLGEVTVFGHARQLDQAAQGELAPAAAHLGPTQRRHQVTGLALQLRLSRGQQLDLRAQRRVGITPLAFERLCLGLGPLDRYAQWLYQLRDCGLTLLERAAGDCLIASQRLARELQEAVAVEAHALARHLLKGGAQALLRLLQHLHTRGFRARRCFQANASRFQLHAQRFDAACGTNLRPCVATGCSHDQSGHRGNDDECAIQRQGRTRWAR